MKGIDKGDIISSGAPQIAKDGRTSTDFTQSRRAKLGGTCYQMSSNIHLHILLGKN